MGDIKDLEALGLNLKNLNVEVRAPRLYESSNFVAGMKNSGWWTLDREAIEDLELGSEYAAMLAVLDDSAMAYTVMVYNFMQRAFKSQPEELRLIYRKVERHVNEFCSKKGIEMRIGVAASK